MRILIALILLVVLGGGAWILSYETRFVPMAPCRSNLDGMFIVEKDCEEYWANTRDTSPSSAPDALSRGRPPAPHDLGEGGSRGEE
jgi:hypothetical protein